MEEDVVPVPEDEVNFDTQDLLGDPARHEISQTSLEIMQLLAECEGGHEVFGNIHQGNFIYDSASLVGSSSELSDIFQDDGQISAHSGHRLDDILGKSIDSLSKSPKNKTSKSQEDSSKNKKPRKSKETLKEKASQKSSKSKIKSSRRKKDSEGDSDGKSTRKRRVKLSRSPTSHDAETGKELSNDVENLSSSPQSVSSLYSEKNSKYKIGESGIYTCSICGKKFSVLKSLQIHSTVHRRKVKLVRKSQSKEDSELHRTGRKSSTQSIKNTRPPYTELVHNGTVLSGYNKAAAGVCVYEISPKRTRLDTSRHDVCSKTSPINGVCSNEGKASRSRNPKCSGSSEFSNTRIGNTSCSKTLESLSKHGTQEYLTLSSKKSTESCCYRTPSINSGNDIDLVVKSTAKKTTDIQISKIQKKSVIPRRESSRTECDNTKKRYASDRYSGEKQPMKRVCLLDRFREDHGSEETGTSENSDDLCTVDTDPNTNGGLLQQFVVDSSLESSKKGRTRVCIKRGQLVRKRTVKSHKSSAGELGNVVVENSIAENTSCKENGLSVVGSTSDKDMSKSMDSDKSSCIVANSRKDVTQQNQNGDQCQTMSTSQSTNTVSTHSSALDSKSEYCQTIHPKKHSPKLQHADQLPGNNEGSTGDNTFHQDLDNSMKRKAILSTTTQIVSLLGGSNEKTLHTSRRTGRKGEAVNGSMEDHYMSTTDQNRILPTPSSTDDSCVDLKSNDKEVVAIISDKGNLESKQTFSSNNEEFNSKPLPSEKSDAQTSLNKLLSCESKTMEFRTDHSEECSDCDRESVSDVSPSNSSDDESEPLVFYRHSCRTLPLCALLKLARRQKLAHDLSVNVHDTFKEKNGYEQGNQQVMSDNENDLSRKAKNVSSLSQGVKDMSPSKMTGLMSSYDKEAITMETPVNRSSTDLPNNSSVGFASVSKCLLMDPQMSVRVSESATVSAAPNTSDKMSKSLELSSKQHSSDQDRKQHSSDQDRKQHSSDQDRKQHSSDQDRKQHSSDQDRKQHSSDQDRKQHSSDQDRKQHSSNQDRKQRSSDQDNLESPPTDQDHSTSPLENTTSAQCHVEQQGIICEEKSDHRGNCLPQALCKNHNNSLPLPVVQCDVSVGPCVVEKGSDKVTQQLHEIRTDSDVLGCSNQHTSTDCTLSSLKSIADDNCTEILKSEIQRCYIDSEDDERDMSVETATSEAGEEAENDVFDRNHLQGNNEESDHVDDSVDEFLDDSSVNHVSDRCLDDNSVSLATIKCLNDLKDYDHENPVTSSRFPKEETSMYFSKGSDGCFKPYQIEVQQNLPRNLMSTCNVVGTFADDMVTGMINVIDTGTNSSDSVSSKFHDYCARQISFQNFLHWKLNEDHNKEVCQDSSICARMLSYQAFHRTKSQSLSTERPLEGIPQLCDTTGLHREEHSGNVLIKQPFYSLEQGGLKGSDSKEITRSTEQTAVTGSHNTVAKSEEQPEVTKKGEKPVLDITFAVRREQLVTTELNLNAVLSEDVQARSEGIRARSESSHANSEGIHVSSEGIHVSSEKCEGSRASSEGVGDNSEGSCANSEGVGDNSEGSCANSEGVGAISCDYMNRTMSQVVNGTFLDSEENRNISGSYVPGVVSTDINQNESVTSGTASDRLIKQLSKDQQPYIDYGYSVKETIPDNPVSVCSKGLSSDKGETSEDECDVIYTSNQADTCARVQPFETNIMHKFSDKTKLLFQEYHDRQQNSMDISYSDTEGRSSGLERFSTENQTQTVSSLEENECSVYEMHMLGSVSSGNSNSANNQDELKGSTASVENKTFSAQKLTNTKELVNPRDTGDSQVSSCNGLTSKSDMVPFKSSMNIFNLEDISTSLISQQNILLSESEQRYLKSPKKLWYRNYMGRMSPAEEGRGDNPKTTSETSSHQKAFVFPELHDSERHNDFEDELSRCLDPSSTMLGKENTPEKNWEGETKKYSEPLEFNGHLCETVSVNGEESQSFNVCVRQSDDDYASDTTNRFDVCSRMRQFRKRRSCARACRDGYVSGCARSRLFVKKACDKS